MKQFLNCFAILFTIVVTQIDIKAQPTFKYGFGVGVNFTLINEINAFPLFEDISGAEITSRYSPVFSNFGNQYFFHGELLFSNFIIALKPGNYTYRFSKTDEILFNLETVEQRTEYLLRYLSIPLEVKYMVGSGTFKPFVGGSLAYGYLLHQGGSGNHSFIRSRFVIGPIVGGYYSLSSFDLVLTVGYDLGLHQVTNKADRFSTGTATPFSQSDIKVNDLNASISVLFSIGSTGGGNSSGGRGGKGSLDCPTPNSGRASKKNRSFKKRK